MSVRSSWADGLRRVRRAPALLLVLWAATLVVTIPPALFLHDEISTSLGPSVEADTAADGVNYNWMQEFRASAGPLGRTLRPDVIGFAAVLDNTSALVDVSPRSMVMIASGAGFIVLLWFLTAGIVHRLAADCPIRIGGFLGTCGAFLFRMLRLGLVSTLVYAALFGPFHEWLFGSVLESVTRNMTVERSAFFVRVACYGLFLGLVAMFNLLFDFAKVRLVVEDRRSIVASIAAGGRFIRNRPGLAAGVYTLNVGTLGVVLAVYAMVAPGAGGAGWGMWAGLAVSQAFILARLAVKLSFWGGEISALQTELAHPGFVRRQLHSGSTTSRSSVCSPRECIGIVR